MPFGEPFDSYYRDIYAPGIKDAGLEPVRADEIRKPGVIMLKKTVEDYEKMINEDEGKRCIREYLHIRSNIMSELQSLREALAD